MKKTGAMIFAILMILVFAINCFAAASDGLREAVLSDLLIQDESLTAEDVLIRSEDTLSNGMILFTYSFKGAVYPAVMRDEIIGNYRHEYTEGSNSYLYDGTHCYSVKYAYDNGLIDDAILDEIAVLHYFTKISEDTTEVLTEEATEAPTEAVTEAATEKATPDSVAPTESAKAGPAVKTGETGVWVVMIALLSVAVIMAAAARKRGKN